MKVTKYITQELEVTEGLRQMTFKIDNYGTCIGFDSNLPHRKKLDDWEFVYKAIKRMLKELKK